MKQFFESYGGVALGILALLVLIAMITPVGNIIKTSLQGTTNKFASSMNGQLDDAMVATAEAQKNATKMPINKNGVIGDFSAKGNIVEINGKQFRVLEANGNLAKVVMIENYNTYSFGYSQDYKTDFNGKEGIQYDGSELDKSMDYYYRNLPEAIQNAIVEQNIKQSMYKISNSTNNNVIFSSWKKQSFSEYDSHGSTYYLEKVTDINVGNRKVFALDIDEVIDYLGANSTPQDVNELFFNQRNSNQTNIWLRTASERTVGNGFQIRGGEGGIGENGRVVISQVRPAFVIDLSLL